MSEDENIHLSVQRNCPTNIVDTAPARDQDVDEGIGDSETDLRPSLYSDCTDSSGPLQSSYGLSTGLGAHTDVHAYISETIHRQNLSESRGEERTDSSSPSSIHTSMGSPVQHDDITQGTTTSSEIVLESPEGANNAKAETEDAAESSTTEEAAVSPGGIQKAAEENWDAENNKAESDEDDTDFHPYFRASHHINSLSGERSMYANPTIGVLELTICVHCLCTLCIMSHYLPVIMVEVPHSDYFSQQ